MNEEPGQRMPAATAADCLDDDRESDDV